MPAHWDILKEVVDSKAISIPIIGNGDVFTHDDIQKFKEQTGFHSFQNLRKPDQESIL